MGLQRRQCLLSGLGLAACGSVPEPPARVMAEQALSWTLADAHGQQRALRFWLHLPRGYRSDGPAWPLLVFLHGSGERGSDLDLVKLHGPPRLAAQGRDFPFVLVSPQLDAGRRWEPLELHTLRTALLAQLHVDPQRVSATGLSLGGRGVWHWAARFPDTLAAIAPVCGFGRPADACALKQVPVRAYHGAEDSVVPLRAQQAMVDAHRACGGQVDFIVYPGVDHNAWDPAYADPTLVPWLLAARTHPVKAPA